MIDFKRCPDGMPCSGNCAPFGCQRDAAAPLVVRLEAAGRDERLSTGALYLEAATALSLAQTEIKGHMRVADELQVKIAELEKDNKLWHANWEAAHAEVQEARDFIVEQSKGNLGGGERPVEFLLASYKLMAHKQTQAKARIAELEKLLIQVREEWYGYTPYSKLKQDIDAALKSRA